MDKKPYFGTKDVGDGNPLEPGKSRFFGCVLIGLAGIAGFVLSFATINLSIFMVALFLMVSCGMWFGLGLILFPWLKKMFEFQSLEDFSEFSNVVPPIWKTWIRMGIGIAVITAIVCGILTRSTRI